MVTITGTVPDENYRWLAEDTVRALPGVTPIDKIVADKFKARAIDDASLKGMVIFAIRTHSPGHVETIDVVARDGNVTLSGQVPSALHKDIVA